MAKNLMAKMRDKDHPYEVYRNNNGWEWRVLQHHQSLEREAKNPYASVYCFVTSPFCQDGEYGDTYLSSIRELGGVLKERDETVYARLASA